MKASAVSKHRDLLDLINGGGRFTPISGLGSSSNSTTYAPVVNVTSLPGEPAGASVPRVLREQAWLMGFSS